MLTCVGSAGATNVYCDGSMQTAMDNTEVLEEIAAIGGQVRGMTNTTMVLHNSTEKIADDETLDSDLRADAEEVHVASHDLLYLAEDIREQVDTLEDLSDDPTANKAEMGAAIDEINVYLANCTEILKDCHNLTDQILSAVPESHRVYAETAADAIANLEGIAEDIKRHTDVLQRLLDGEEPSTGIQEEIAAIGEQVRGMTNTTMVLHNSTEKIADDETLDSDLRADAEEIHVASHDLLYLAEDIREQVDTLEDLSDDPTANEAEMGAAIDEINVYLANCTEILKDCHTLKDQILTTVPESHRAYAETASDAIYDLEGVVDDIKEHADALQRLLEGEPVSAGIQEVVEEIHESASQIKKLTRTMNKPAHAISGDVGDGIHVQFHRIDDAVGTLYKTAGDLQELAEDSEENEEAIRDLVEDLWTQIDELGEAVGGMSDLVDEARSLDPDCADAQELQGILTEFVVVQDNLCMQVDALGAMVGVKRPLDDVITPEELFESLSGGWIFEGSMTLGNNTTQIAGTRTVTLNGTTSADFVVKYRMGETEATDTGSAWWDDEREQFAIQEGDEIGYSNLTINGFESREVHEDGILELGISEAVVLEESLTIIDDTTQISEWSAVNMAGETVARSEIAFMPVTTLGVLIIAHGSSSESWCAPVRATVANVSLPYPVALGFLEKVPGESIEDAVDKLNIWNVSEIVAVPLFVSSSSNHISEIEYILRLGDAIPGEDDLVQVNTTANITLTAAMDDHWMIGSILADNAADMSEAPCNETAVLVSHGVSDDEAIFVGWNESSASLAEQTLLRLRHLHNLDIKGVCYSFINLNETLHPDLAVRAVVEEISSDSTPVVLPRILSPGYHTKRKIPALLENLTYLYDNETTLATHPALAEWIDISVYEAVSDLSFSVYDSENGEIVDLTIEEAAADHEGGKICPCVAVAWRASQFALSEVWSDVDQSDLEITSAHPSDGHEETFLYILNNSTADYTIDMPEGTDPKNLTTENYVYTFTSKSTGDSVTVRVKGDAFPDKLFDLRKKCKAGTATPDEKKAFKLIKDELKDGFLYLPMDELFDFEVEHAQSDTGVLLIAHGSSSESWCAPVRAVAGNVDLPYPVELGFLEGVLGESIEDAVDKLNSRGVSEIVAVPLFVSSSSNHIGEIEYILGLGDAIPGEDDLVQVNTTANITLTSAMDDHWIISSILADHAADLSEDPCNETVVTISHGVSDDEDIFAGWNESGASLAEQTLLRLRYLHNLDIGGSRYSLARLNETLHPEIAARAVVEDVSATSTPVVLPLFLSPGYNTNMKIPAMLENLTYVYDSEKTLAAHPALAEWIGISVYEAVSDPSFSVYDSENGEIVDLTIEEAVAGHEGGKLCPCVAVAWRASQFALSEVWSDVDQSDLEITSAHPSDGHEETFLYILNNSTADYTIEMPEGTDPKNLTTENYVYTFTSKSTGDSVTVRVKDDVFPDKLFDLRKKCKAGTATPDEKKAFKLIKDELKDGFLYLPVDELFDSEVTYTQFDTGILVVAHGSPSEMWCAPVRAAARNVDLPYPVELGFLEFVPGETINAAVDRLDKHGVEKIIAVPLFVSSHSDHIAEVEYVLGLRDSLPGAHDANGGHGADSASEMGVMSSAEAHTGMTTFASGKEVRRSVVQRGDKYFISRIAVAGHPGGDSEEELVPVETDAAITLTGAIDDHWLIGEILADRVRALSTNPANETAVLVAHGADNETDIAGWINDSKSLAEQVNLRLRFISGEEPALDLAGVRYSFLFHNETLHPNIKTRAVVEDVSATSGALVVPFMVSPGFFTGTFIPQTELANLTYAYDGDALLPHLKIADLIEIKASEKFTDLAFPVYDSESDETVNITIEGAAASYDGNTTCCVALAFRASQFALSEEQVGMDRNDIEIVSANPSEAQEAVFLYILGNSTADYVVEMPEGTDPMNLTKENFVYTFTRKSTGESVTVSVKDSVFPDELLDLRKKCKAGTATPDEKKAFELTKREIKDKFMYLPMNELFETQSPSLKGDVNGDGVVTTADAVIVLEMTTSGEWKKVADVNGDCSTTSLDALIVTRAVAGEIEL